MISFMEQALSYAMYHQRPLTRYVQFAGIAVFILALMILLSCVHLSIPGIFELNLAVIATVIILLFYARLNWQLAATLAPIFIFLCWVGGLFSYPTPTLFTVWVFLLALILGCALQFAGFFVEGKRPKTVSENTHQILMAPLFMAAEIFFMLGLMQKLKEDIYGKVRETH